MKNLPRAVLEFGDHRLGAFVARGAKERALGLMHVRELAADEGMLFVCGEPQPQSFWMKDTPLALSIAFIDDGGTIVQMDDMQAHSEDATECRVPVRYVLEVPQGWFAERGIAPGARVTGPVFLDAGVEGGGGPSSQGA